MSTCLLDFKNWGPGILWPSLFLATPVFAAWRKWLQSSVNTVQLGLFNLKALAASLDFSMTQLVLATLQTLQLLLHSQIWRRTEVLALADPLGIIVPNSNLGLKLVVLVIAEILLTSPIA